MIKAILSIISSILKIFINIAKGDQPTRDEIESSTDSLQQEDKELQKQLEKEINKKETENGKNRRTRQKN